MSEQLAKISFLPWLLQGLGAKMNGAAEDMLRAPAGPATAGNPGMDWSVKIWANQRGDKKVPAKTVSINKSLLLYGPGDVIGIEKRAIIKTEPMHQSVLEPNFLPYIEFYEEDFPWRYTPLAPNGERLRPWLALIVLKEEEFEKDPVSTLQPLASISLKHSTPELPLPPPYQLWAWAHVQVNGEVEEATKEAVLQDLIQNSPNLASSRLICPRKLEADTAYSAFLIPAFEAGRLAGLGASGETIDSTDAQLAAWGHETDHFPHRFPYYFDWSFKTGKAGEDFETLVRKIKPQKLHEHVGKRHVDIQSPGHNLHYTRGEYPFSGALLMEGALQHPDSEYEDLLDSAAEADQQFTSDLAALINLEEDLKLENALADDHPFAKNPFFEEEEASIYDDPIISPSLYGKWHLQKARVDPKGNGQWADQLNLDPRHRIAAGLGAAVIRRNQEDYMERAWQQYGALFDINTYLRQSQFALEVNKRLHKKHFQQLSTAAALEVTAPLHSSLSASSTVSVKKYMAQHVPKGTFSTSFSKIYRPGGPVMRRALSHTKMESRVAQSAVITNLSNRKITQTDLPIAPNPIDENTVPGEVPPNAPDVKPVQHPLWDLFNGMMDGLAGGTIPAWKAEYLKELGIINPSALRESAEELRNYFAKRYWQWPKNAKLNVPALKAILIQKTDPQYTYPKRVKSRLKNIEITNDPQDNTLLEPIMRAPVFDDPMYEEILKIAFDAFLPNLDLVPSNTVSLMKPNRAFIESFMVGLNHEMARELLWREFPTDQRGSYFRHFWESIDRDFGAEQQQYDIQPIHQWTADSALGSHPGEGSEKEQLVLVIRGELLHRYPHTIIYLEKAEKRGQHKIQLSGEIQLPVFEAKVAPDLFFLGFNISKEEATEDPGWFFVFKERPGEVHFGMDSVEQFSPESPGNLQSWDDLNWAHLPELHHYINIDIHQPPAPANGAGCAWGWGAGFIPEDLRSGSGSSADMACILYQNPVKMAIHAGELLSNL